MNAVLKFELPRGLVIANEDIDALRTSFYSLQSSFNQVVTTEELGKIDFKSKFSDYGTIVPENETPFALEKLGLPRDLIGASLFIYFKLSGQTGRMCAEEIIALIQITDITIYRGWKIEFSFNLVSISVKDEKISIQSPLVLILSNVSGLLSFERKDLQWLFNISGSKSAYDIKVSQPRQSC